jgi:hypothetical protein
MSRNLTTWCGYEASADDCPELLELLVETAEDVRVRRRVHGPLVCANVAVFGPDDVPSARTVLDWPAWILRNLYAPVGLMVGRFWIGEERNDKHSRVIAPPPVSFFSIRHSFPPQDARFLAKMPHVAARLAEANDDGRDVLPTWLGTPLSPQAVRDRYSELVKMFPPERAVAP